MIISNLYTAEKRAVSNDAFVTNGSAFKYADILAYPAVIPYQDRFRFGSFVLISVERVFRYGQISAFTGLVDVVRIGIPDGATIGYLIEIPNRYTLVTPQFGFLIDVIVIPDLH